LSGERPDGKPRLRARKSNKQREGETLFHDFGAVSHIVARRKQKRIESNHAAVSKCLTNRVRVNHRNGQKS
jgi:hypothetical protein